MLQNTRFFFFRTQSCVVVHRLFFFSFPFGVEKTYVRVSSHFGCLHEHISKNKKREEEKKGSICSILLASDKEIHSGLKPLLR